VTAARTEAAKVLRAAFLPARHLVALLAIMLAQTAGPGAALGAELGAELADMTGCWVTKETPATSLETDSTKPGAIQVVWQKMLLMFERMENTEHLVYGHIYEWDDHTVLGPQYQNGVFDPIAKNLTFGFPEGGLDTVYSLDRDTLLYVHKKSSTLSAMSVRHMSRLDCAQARVQEQELLQQKERESQAGGG
jgi:hypothetical protein